MLVIDDRSTCATDAKDEVERRGGGGGGGSGNFQRECPPLIGADSTPGDGLSPDIYL